MSSATSRERNFKPDQEKRMCTASASGVANVDDVNLGLTGGTPPHDGVADLCADHRVRERRGPADLARRDVGLVVTDDAELVLRAVLAFHLHDRAEVDEVARLVRRIDERGAVELR